MSKIVICGGSVIGLAMATMLARDGHEVTVLDRDPSEVPSSPMKAWEVWERKGVPQFRQPHNLFPRYRKILEDELPEVLDGLLEAGGRWASLLESLPPSLDDQNPRLDDDRFRFVTGRRPLVECVHARCAKSEFNVTIRRGVKVEGLTSKASVGGVPRVAGVRTASEEIDADLVIDAMGRRSPAVDWLASIGARPAQVHSHEDAFVYYTQYFTGPEPPRAIAPAVSPVGTFLILTLLGDNSTWSVTLWAPASDSALKELRHPDKFAKVVKACPLHAHWLDGEAITGVMPMAGILDQHRRFVVDDEPVATGFAAVGDAWACTNPSAGRGLSVGLLHAQHLRDVIRSSIADPYAFAMEWDAVTEEAVAPWYWNQLAADQARLEQVAAVREGRAEAVTTIAPLPPQYEAAGRAMSHDADVLRAVLETIGCLALPQEVFTRDGLWDKVEAAAGDPLVLPCPTRKQLLELLA